MISIWIWVISFVDLVIREAVENLSNSVFEKLSTLSNAISRRFFASPAAVFADR